MASFSDVDNLKEFLRKKGKNSYSGKLDALHHDEVNRLIDTLNAIGSDYTSNTIRAAEQRGIITAFSHMLDELHSRCDPVHFTHVHRIKSTESLLLKILTKYLEKKDDYIQIDTDNYYKIVMDLTGFRVLYRYPQEWKAIDAHLRGGKLEDDTEIGNPLFVDKIENYVRKKLSDYSGDSSRQPFIAELPIWYYLDTKKVELATDVSLAGFNGYDHIDTLPPGTEERFQRIPSSDGYRSLHYIINVHGKYVELQVRTLFDEAWAECSHDLVYRFPNTKSGSTAKKEVIDAYSLTLAHQMGVGRDIAEKMFGMFGGYQEDEAIRVDLHRTMSSQIRVVGDLNGRIAGLTKRPTDIPVRSVEGIVAGDWVKNNM